MNERYSKSILSVAHHEHRDARTSSSKHGDLLDFVQEFVRSYLRSHVSDGVILGLSAVIIGAFGAGVSGSRAAGILIFVLVILTGLIILLRPLFKTYALQRDIAGLIEAGESLHISSVVERPSSAPDKFYFDALTRLTADARSEIGQLRAQRMDQERYMELWVHEIKTPLTALNLVCQKIDEPMRSTILREITHLDTLVEQALYVARLKSFNQDFKLEHVDLALVCKEACKRMARAMIECGVTPQIDIADQTVVTTDAKQLEFILRQLIQNALQYGAHHIRLSTQPNEGEACVLKISDDGWGIPSQDITRIFERGFTGKNGRAYGSSTGMGLYLCAEMCQAMGVGISAESAHGEGTVIKLVLPYDVDRFAFEKNRRM